MTASAVIFHCLVGGFWGALAAIALWESGRTEALRSAAIAALVMAAISAGCDTIRSKHEIDCRPAGPSIYSDC